jgi:transcription elongation factor
MLNKILSQLDQLSKDELLTLNSAVIKMAKAKSRVESVIKGATLKVGQEVEINQVKHRGQKFIITKVNRTRCKIQAKDNRLESYNCPISMLIA